MLIGVFLYFLFQTLSSIEPTLQAALLPSDIFKRLKTVNKMHNARALKGSKQVSKKTGETSTLSQYKVGFSWNA